MIDDPSSPDKQPRPGADPAIRDVIALVQRTHVGRAGLSPSAMLKAAAALHALPGAPPEAATFEDLALALSLLLDEASRGDAAARNGWRARLLDAALKAADRWSSASSGRRRADQQSRRIGEIAGIGVRVGRRDGALRVLGVLPESGAADAGLRAGDDIVTIAGHDAAALSVTAALALLRGVPGTRVALTTSRHPLAVSVERRALPQPSVQRVMRDDGVGVLRIERLTRRTTAEAARALSALSGRGMRALILDLRGNTGGSMLAGAGVADLFLSTGLIAEALDDNDQPVPGLQPRVLATPGGDVTTPLLLLVDRRTASSAELLAAALAWNGRARIAGERTFGKGVVGKPHAFDEWDLTVTITSAFMRAAGRRLPAQGLVPDVEIACEGDAALAEAAHLLR